MLHLKVFINVTRGLVCPFHGKLSGKLKNMHTTQRGPAWVQTQDCLGVWQWLGQ